MKNTPRTDYVPQRFKACLEYIEKFWPEIIREQKEDSGTLIGLPKKFVVPNCGMFNELYYWDTYFITRGLVGTPRESLLVDLTDNLVYLVERFGKIPNATRFYFLSRSQPPFLTSMILDALEVRKRSGCDEKENREWLTRAVAAARKEYELVWRGKAFPDEREVFRGLSRYYDINIWHNAAEAESGWDMTPRYQDRCLDFLAIDLNALLFKYESDFVKLYEDLGERSEAQHFLTQAQVRRDAVTELMWDETTGLFHDYDFRSKQRSSFKSLASFFTLWSGLATSEQAAVMASRGLQHFEKSFGVVTTEEWHPPTEEQRRQWAWPNGWAPLQSVVVNGLLNYGYADPARRIALKWVELVNQIFEQTGVIYEKYNVVEGKRARSERYPDQAGFGWTNAVFVEFVKLIEGQSLVQRPTKVAA